MYKWGGMFAAAIVAALLLAACGGDDDGGHMDGGMMAVDAPPGAITVQLLNWAVKPSQKSAKAGDVTFYAVHNEMHGHGANSAGKIHELAVARKRPDGSFEVMATTGNLAMGEAKNLALTLEPGDYELQCNVVEEVDGKVVAHYREGMKTRFKVT